MPWIEHKPKQEDYFREKYVSKEIVINGKSSESGRVFSEKPLLILHSFQPRKK